MRNIKRSKHLVDFGWGKKATVKDFPGKTLHEIRMSLQMLIETKNRYVKFIEAIALKELHEAHTWYSHDRMCTSWTWHKCQTGLGNISKQEEILWHRGILGDDDAEVLLNTLVYYFCLNFALRAGQEHHNLSFKNSQIQILHVPSKIIKVEKV